jgi:hypothetical protein
MYGKKIKTLYTTQVNAQKAAFRNTSSVCVYIYIIMVRI